MKKLLFLCMLMPLFSKAQSTTKKGNEVFFEVMDTCGLTKDQLYEKSKLWLVNTFHDINPILDIDDKDSGKLASKGNFNAQYSDYAGSYNFVCWFMVSIRCKDSSYRLRFDNMQVVVPSVSEDRVNLENLDTNTGIQQPINDGIQKVIYSYKTSIVNNNPF